MNFLLQKAFDQHATKSDASADLALDSASLGQALQELGPASGDAQAVLVDMDLNKDGRVDFEEFLSAMTMPSAAEAWAKRGAWWEIVAGSMPCGETKGSGHDDPLRRIAELSDEEVAAVWEVIAEEMEAELRSRISDLRRSFEQMDGAKKKNEEGGAGASVKFQTFKASAGTVEDFHKGLGGRVGINPPPIKKTIFNKFQ